MHIALVTNALLARFLAATSLITYAVTRLAAIHITSRPLRRKLILFVGGRASRHTVNEDICTQSTQQAFITRQKRMADDTAAFVRTKDEESVPRLPNRNRVRDH